MHGRCPRAGTAPSTRPCSSARRRSPTAPGSAAPRSASIWGDALGDPDKLGLDAIFPAFFFGLLLNELRSRRARGVAALGTALALVLIPFTPPGVPVLVASLASLVGLTKRARAEVRESQEAEGEPR